MRLPVIFPCYIMYFFISLPLCSETAVVTVAIDQLPPYSSVDQNGQPSGLLIDLMELLSEEELYDFEFVECPWSRCLRLVKNCEVDLLPGLAINKQRQTEYNFIEPPFVVSKSDMRLYSLKPSESIAKLDDLNNLSIGSLRGTLNDIEFDNHKNIRKVHFVDVESLFNSVIAKRIDAFVYNDKYIEPILARLDPGSLINASLLTFESADSGYLAMSKCSKKNHLIPRLSSKLNELVLKGDIERLFNRYNL